jgi:thiol-disulfide isomerase/thioredoxin
MKNITLLLGLCMGMFGLGFGQKNTVQSLTISQLDSLIKENPNELLIINFWATFCKPCVEEIPHFIRVVERNAKRPVRLILVSVDAAAEYPRMIQRFAQKKKWNVPLYWLNETDPNYFCPAVDSSWSGSIPATLFVSSTKNKGVRLFWERPISETELEEMIVELTQ